MTEFNRRQLLKLTGAALSPFNRALAYFSAAVTAAYASACSQTDKKDKLPQQTMTTPTGTLFFNPIVKPLNSVGTFMSGCTATFYFTGTTDLAPIYADGALTVPLANPLSSDASGTFVAIYLDPTIVYRAQIKTSAGVLVSDTDPYILSSFPRLSANGIGALLYPKSAAEITAGVTIVNSQHPVGDVRRYGAKGDGLTNDAPAFIAAFSIAGVRVRIPASQTPYFINRNLGVPVCGSVSGDGWNNSIIKCGAAVTRLISITGACATLYEDFRITGNSTANALGIVLGDGALTSLIALNNLMIGEFTGKGAAGLKLDQIVTLHAFNCILQASNNNLITGATPSFPTTCHFWGGWIQTALHEGAIIKSGSNVCFHRTIVEVNRKAGILAQTAAGCLIEDLLIDADCWFEDNWHDHTDTGTQVFDVVVDGTNGADATKTSVIIRDSRFSHGTSPSSDRRALNLIHSCASLENMRCYYGFPYEIVVSTNDCRVQCVGDSADRMTRFISNPTAATVIAPIFSQVIELGTGLSLNPGTWQNWTPTYSSSAGNAATSFVGGAVTTTLARFVVLGKHCTVTVSFSSTLNAVTPNALFLTLPAGMNSANGNTIQACLTSDAATSFNGLVQTNGGNTLKILRDVSLNRWGSGHACSAQFSFTFEIQ